MNSRAPDLLAISAGDLGTVDRVRAWFGSVGEASVAAAQLREKRASDRELERFAGVALDLLPASTALLINGRADIATAVGAAGVHLPASGIPTPEARRLLGSRALIGRSTHRLEEVEIAFAEGVDYVSFGPVFATPSKLQYGPPVGLDALAAAARLGEHVVALGGITMDNAVGCVEAGAHGIAGISLFRRDDDLRQRVRRLRRLLTDAHS